MNVRTGIFFAAAVFAAVSAVDEINVKEEAAFADATEFVQNWMSEGKDETACEKVANTAIKAIEDECKTLQVDIDERAKDNDHCCDTGLDGISTAKAAHEQSKKNHQQCTEEFSSIKKVKIDFGKISYETLNENMCKQTFFNSPAYQEHHQKVEAKKMACVKIDGETSGLKTAVDDATKAACNARKKCEGDAAAKRDKTFNESNAACSSKQNQDAFTRAHHMLCVLKGTSLQGCNVPTAPSVKKTAMSKNECKADVGTCSETHKAWDKIPENTKAKGLEGNNAFADAIQSQGLCKVSDWTDSESICHSEVPTHIFADGACRKGKSKHVGIWVTYQDGTDGYATYAGVQNKWCKTNFAGINPTHVGGMMKNCNGLHFLTDHSCKGLPMAWSGCKTKYSGNFDVDFSAQQCSDWRANTKGWGKVRIRLYCDCAAIGA